MAFVDAVALTPITLTELTAASIASLAAADGTNGNKFVANRRTMLRVKNASGGSITVTVHVNYSVLGLALPDKTFTVPATTGDVLFSGFAGIFDEDTADTDVDVYITFSAASSVTLQVINPL